MSLSESLDEFDGFFPTDDLLTALANLHATDVKISGNHANSRKLSVKELKILRSENGSTNQKQTTHARIVGLWRSAYQMVLRQGDIWAQFHLDKLPVELAKRYRYSPIKSEWVEDIVRVRMEPKAFGRGAMRECFRVKKLSNFSHSEDWSHALNFVAKRYIDKVEPQVYFDDVRLQMDAKLWAEEFSRQPAIIKKVDIAQMCVLEFINRPDKPLYHLEHFIEGTYRKYNSNSGFVDDFARNTPQAFSHFTFEQSGHHLLVVDIQGVGDLWTDPQIHTYDGKAYGDGNLGIRGMALFFHTHRCNPLCEALKLDPFDLCPGEQSKSALIQQHVTSCNGSNGVIGQAPKSGEFTFGLTVALPRSARNCRRQRSENDSHVAPIFVNPDDFTEPHSLPSEKLAFLPATSPVVNKALNMDNSNFLVGTPEHRGELHSSNEFGCECLQSPFTNSNDTTNDSGVFFAHPSPSYSKRYQRRTRFISDSFSEDDAGSMQLKSLLDRETEAAEYFNARRGNHRSSCVGAQGDHDADVLGTIHHELARLHAIGRFAPQPTAEPTESSQAGADALAALQIPKEINWEAVIFHEEQAALLQCSAAVECLSQYYLGLDINGPLEECPIKPDPEEAGFRGLTLMSTAASAGDRRAMIYLADMYYTGRDLTNRGSSEPDWLAAVHWYQKAINVDRADEDRSPPAAAIRTVGYDSMSLDWPVYRLHGRLGEMYANGGYGLERDCAKAYEFYESAADGANEAMQGRLAMQYYDQAALLEEEFEQTEE